VAGGLDVTMPDGAGWLRITTHLDGVRPAEVVGAFVAPELVRRWWGADLADVPRAGGPYVARSAKLDQTMRGSVLALDAPRGLFAFTWSWDHRPDLPRRRVSVQAEAVDAGCRVRLDHGPYDDGELDRDDAESHRQGWVFFLPRLADVLADVLVQERFRAVQGGANQ
jgi:uncharacterized protein YndB with AHSA1/START domain